MTPGEISKLRPNAIDSAPKYLQIARNITDLIERNAWPADHGLPSERQLVDLLEVSRVTARRALKVVSDKGLVVRRRGSGTYVAPRLEQPLSKLSSFSEELHQRGLQSSSTWLLQDTAVANSHELMTLGLKSGERVARLKRLRRADGAPMAVEYSRLPRALLPEPLAVQHSLYAWLDEAGTPVVRALQRMSASNATPEQARLLEVEPGTALIFVTRVGYGRDGRAIELTESFCRVDVYEFVAELTRSPNVDVTVSATPSVST
jgi:GntR family transcriptional regulator